MTFIRVTTPSESTGETRAMYLRQQKRFGYVPNYAKVFSERPDIMRLWADLQSGIRSHMDSRRFELVTLAASIELGSSYCALAHARVLSERFLEEDEVRAIAAGQLDSLTPLERAMMDLSRRVCADASSVTQGDVDPLKAHGLCDAEIFDIVAVAAGRSFFSKVVDALGAEPDAAFLELDSELRRRLIVGRAISAEPPERIVEAEE